MYIIASIINNSISSGTFPDKLKEAIPIFKSGNEGCCWTIILPTISKIYERHIATQLNEYFSRTKFIILNVDSENTTLVTLP